MKGKAEKDFLVSGIGNSRGSKGEKETQKADRAKKEQNQNLMNIYNKTMEHNVTMNHKIYVKWGQITSSHSPAFHQQEQQGLGWT